MADKDVVERLEAVRNCARKAEAPLKAAADPSGLWWGATAIIQEQAIAEISRLRAELTSSRQREEELQGQVAAMREALDEALPCLMMHAQDSGPDTPEVRALRIVQAALSAVPANAVGQILQRLREEKRVMEIYVRVCGELADGKKWEDIDNGLTPNRGLRGERPVSKAYWTGYMERRFINTLESLISSLPGDQP